MLGATAVPCACKHLSRLLGILRIRTVCGATLECGILDEALHKMCFTKKNSMERTSNFVSPMECMYLGVCVSVSCEAIAITNWPRQQLASS